jgi:hypothetical protein
MKANSITPTKICTGCKIDKSRADFGKRTRAKDGLFSECSLCHSNRAKKRYLENKGHINKINAKWKAENPEKHHAINVQWRADHPDEHREAGKRWYRENKLQRHKASHEWYMAHAEEVTQRNAQWKAEHPEQAKLIRMRTQKKIRSTPRGKLNCNMRSAIGSSLRGNKKGQHWEMLVGYSVADLKKHLERKFKFGMTWENYGMTWEIDHKVPLVAFNFETPVDIDFRRCWCLENLQPLYVSENRSKNCRVARPFQPALLLCEAVNG